MKSIVSYLFFIGLLLSFRPAQAGNDATLSSWEKDWERIEALDDSGLSDDEQCQQKFDILWRHAKAGNLNARFGLAFFAWGFMHVDHNFMPGHADTVSAQRDRFVLAVHGIGAEWNDPDKGSDYDTVKSYLELSFMGLAPFAMDKSEKQIDALMQCYDESPNDRKCADLAVEEGLVPSWDVYAAEIDALVAQGYKPACLYVHRDHWRNPVPVLERPEEK